MTIRLGVVMDPIGSINTVKDSTYGMLREAQRRGWEIQYMEMNDLYLADGIAGARMRRLELLFEGDEWYRFLDASVAELSQLDVILMRKDPPFDMEYIYCSYILERAYVFC